MTAPPGADPTPTALVEAQGATPRATRIIVAIGVLSLIGGIALSLLQQELGWIESHRADGFSRSALGHAAWYELLKSQGRTVVLSRHATAARVADDDALIVAEPVANDLETLFDDEEKAEALTNELLSAAVPMLLVLPRREVEQGKQSRALYVVERPESVALDPLRRLGVTRSDSEIVRVESAGEGLWTENTLGLEPTLLRPQLMRDVDLEPLLACDEGILIGRTRSEPPRIVLADPDLVATHGIGRGDNAALAMALVELLGVEGTLWVDEVAHGYGVAPSAWSDLFKPPLLWITLHVLVGAALLSWGASVRFGSPRPPQPGFETGKAALLDNVGELMEAGGHAGHSARRYVEETLTTLGATLHAPAALRGAALREWLGERVRDPALRDELRAFDAAAFARTDGNDSTPALALARRAHRLKETVLHAAR
ncbi:MAG: hypothetical protein EXS13_07840 [Planctomycetes bacterium]|nr:hypothetical protein [Planctomycetota bacterium]